MDRGGGGLTPRGRISDGTNEALPTGPAVTAGVLTLVSVVRDVAADTVTVYSNTAAGTPVTDPTTGTLANSDVVRIGAFSGGSNVLDGEVFGASLFRRALSTSELARVKNALLGMAGY